MSDVTGDFAALVKTLLADPERGERAIAPRLRAMEALADDMAYPEGPGQMGWEAFRAVMKYRGQYGHLPPNSDSLLEFALRMPAALRESLSMEVGTILGAGVPIDPDIAIDSLLTAGRKAHLIGSLRDAKDIASVSYADGARELVERVKDRLGPIAAQKFAMPSERLSIARDYAMASLGDDPFKVAVEPGGDLVANAETVEAELVSYQNQAKQRELVLTGFPRIDASLQIGRGFAHKWIGIMGYTNHGKSTLMQAMAINMALKCKSVLYVAIEQQPLADILTAWAAMYAHLKGVPIGAIKSWREGKASAEARSALKRAAKFLAAEDGIKCEAQRMWDWDEIEAHLVANNGQRHYDVLILDYAERMRLGSHKFRDHVQEAEEVFRRAHRLSREFDGGRGIVVITGLQVNKEGVRDVGEQEGEGRGYYRNTLALKQFSNAAQDMDAVIGVWRDEDKSASETEELHVSCPKRRGPPFQNHKLAIDGASRFVFDPDEEFAVARPAQPPPSARARLLAARAAAAEEMGL